MGLIIAHGKGAWGRSNKHKRVDKELEKELNNNPQTETKKVFEETLLSENITKGIKFGETQITKDTTHTNYSSTHNILRHDTHKEKINRNIKIVDKYKIEETEIMFIEDILDWEKKLQLLNGEI